MCHAGFHGCARGIRLCAERVKNIQAREAKSRRDALRASGQAGVTEWQLARE